MALQKYNTLKFDGWLIGVNDRKLEGTRCARFSEIQ